MCTLGIHIVGAILINIRCIFLEQDWCFRIYCAVLQILGDLELSLFDWNEV